MKRKKIIRRTSLKRNRILKLSLFLLLFMGIGYSVLNKSLFMNANIEVSRLKVTVNSGEYLQHGTKQGTDCPAGSFCPGNTFSYNDTEDQGLTSCAIGSFSSEKSNACTPCQGKTTSDIGSTSCDTECSNKTGVNTWEDAVWNNNNSMTNICTVKTCKTGYTKNENSCTANTYNVTLDNKEADTPGSTNVQVTYDADIPTITTPTKRGYTFKGYNNIIEHTQPEENEEILYIKEDGTSARKWDLTEEMTLVAKWEAIKVTCEEGEYLPHDATSCSACPEGSSCAGGEYEYHETDDQGSTLCQAGTYSTGGAKTCSTCSGGVSSEPGQTSCSKTCSNAAHVKDWVSECTISTCDTGYENQSNTCVAKKFNITLDNTDAGNSTTIEVTYNEPIPSITVPEKTGYTFGGYYTEENGQGTKYINADGSSAKVWDKTDVNKLYAKWTIITKNCSSGQYLPKGETTCAACPAGSFCIGGEYSYKANEDQGITKCAVGSYSNTNANSCIACTGLTTSDEGKSSCDKNCTNKDNVSDWNNADWNNNNPTGLCSIKTCTVGYSLDNNTCKANELDFTDLTINVESSTEEVTKNVIGPTTGTGEYTYTKKSGEADITVSSDGTITIPANKASGEYTIVITATDNNSHKTKDATYTIKIKKAAANLTCTDKTYDGTEQTACTCTGGTVGGDFKATNAGSYTASCTPDEDHDAPSDKTWTMNKKAVEEITNLEISPVGVVSWTNSSDATSYQISIDNTNWTSVPAGETTTSYNFLNSIVGNSGERTVYVKGVNSDTTNYKDSNPINTNTTVYTVTINTNNSEQGTVSPTSINVITGETYTTNANVLILEDGREVIATPNTSAEKTYYFQNWSSNDGTITSDTTITVNFTDEITNYNVTYNSNEGTFTDTTTTNSVGYTVTQTEITKYSHTSNIDDTGKKNSNYGNSWNNANITGTDRGDTSKAHVVSIPGASSLTVDIYYNGENTKYDWVTVWEGAHPTYTAYSNYSSGISGGTKLGGSQSGSYTVNDNNLTSMGHSTFTINGDTVTFGFRSDSSGCGSGYGYYAIVTGTGNSLTRASGTYKEPERENYVFDGWNTKNDGSGTSISDESEIDKLTNKNVTLYAKWRRIYTLTFDKNNSEAEGEPYSMPIVSGIPTEIPNSAETAYTSTTMVFDSYNTKADGTGDAYKATDKITVTSDTTLYAQWRRIYTLTFDKNNSEAEGEPYSMPIVSGISTQIPDEAFSAYKQTNMVIDNYNTESDGTGTSYKKGQSITVTSNKTIYAQYRVGTATFKTGQQFNATIKQLAGNSSATYSTTNDNITNIAKYTGTITDELLNNATIISSDASEALIYAWFDNGTIYWYTVSETVYFNSNSSYMFNYLTNIETLDLSEFNLSKVSSSSSVFTNMTKWDTLVTPKVNSSSTISLPKTFADQSNKTYTSITSSTPTETTLKVPYTITFDSSDGERNTSSCKNTGSITTKSVYPGSSLGTVPTITAIKTRYTPDGWTDKDKTQTITGETIPTGNTTYYVKWIKDGQWAATTEVSFDDSNTGTNCQDVQCVLNYIADNFKEKRVSINGN